MEPELLGWGAGRGVPGAGECGCDPGRDVGLAEAVPSACLLGPSLSVASCGPMTLAGKGGRWAGQWEGLVCVSTPVSSSQLFASQQACCALSHWERFLTTHQYPLLCNIGWHAALGLNCFIYLFLF